MLTEDDLRYLLALIAKTLPGEVGYSDNPKVARLQAKLSVMLEAHTSVRTGTARPGVTWAG